jgi:hypothetical protein
MPRQYWIRQEKGVWVKSPSGPGSNKSPVGSQEFPWIYAGKRRVKFERTAFERAPPDAVNRYTISLEGFEAGCQSEGNFIKTATDSVDFSCSSIRFQVSGLLAVVRNHPFALLIGDLLACWCCGRQIAGASPV